MLAGMVLTGFADRMDPQTLLALATSGPSAHALLIWLFNANVVIVLFNMIPAFPLDGGRVLRALLGFFMDWSRATQVSAGIGQFMALGLGVLALFGGNIILAVIAVFVFLAAGMTRDDERARAVLAARNIGDVYNKYALTLDESDRVSRVVDYLLTSYQPDFAVLRNGELLGVVTREQALLNLANSTGDDPVTRAMLTDIPGVDASTPLDEVQRVMLERESRLAAVYDRGVFLGLVSREDLAEALLVISYDQRRRNAQQASEASLHGVVRPA